MGGLRDLRRNDRRPRWVCGCLRKAFLAADAAQDGAAARRATSGPMPTRRGFGSTLIERSLRSYFGGTAETEFPPDGLRFTLDAPLGDAAFQSGTA